jgi:tRNA-specific adenosine deaminase 3
LLTRNSIFKSSIPSNESLTLHHIRRFVKDEFLPEHLRRDSAIERPCPTLQLMVCPVSAATRDELEGILTHSTHLFEPLFPVIRTIPVPLYAPTSATQAAEWSSKYWPIVYKNTNPYGPHPALVARAGLELSANHQADSYVSLAHDVGKESFKSGNGLSIGAVIVERDAKSETKVVAVAGDLRYCGLMSDTNKRQANNPMGHAVMRAIGMVAEKRRSMDTPSSPSNAKSHGPDPFVTLPLTDLEKNYFEVPDNHVPGGYLCLDLELYLTHEPCTMCTMAIMHSRFARVVYECALPKTGALNAEADSLGYGMFWRDQLNWKMLCWQWQADETNDHEARLDESVQA